MVGVVSVRWEKVEKVEGETKKEEKKRHLRRNDRGMRKGIEWEVGGGLFKGRKE